MFDKQMETSVEIAASPQRVWRELTSFGQYGTWSRFVQSIQGEPRVGARLTVKLDDGGGAMVIKPTLIVVRENEELCWEGKLGTGLVFAGQHYFKLIGQPDGYTRFVHGERFRGALVPALWGRLDTRTRKAFEQFNEALRDRSESTVANARPSLP